MFRTKLIAILFILAILSPVFASENGLYESAIKEHKAGSYKKELKTIEKIEKKEGITAKTNLLKYRAYLELDMNKEAKQALLDAIKADKNNFDAHFSLAVLAIQNDDPSEARKYFEKSLEINPSLKNSPEILYWHAKLCIIDEDLPSALEYILNAIEADPYENLYYLELGKIYLSKKDYIKAVNAFSFAMGKNSVMDAECYNYLGLIQYRRRSYKTARENFEKAHNLQPKNIMYLYNLMLCVKSLGDKAEYAKLSLEISEITPNSPLDYLHLSQIAHDKSDYRKADEILQEGAKKFPDNLMLKKAVKKLNKS